MGSFLTDLYKVETLDTRFVPALSVRTRNQSQATPPRWRTLEFYFYGVIFLIFVPLMFITAASAGSSSNPNYALFSDLLTPGWMGRPVDNSDNQYQGFRNQFPILVGVLIGHTLLRRLVSAQSGARRNWYDFIFAIIFVTVLHGVGAVKIVAILGINYYIGKKFLSRKADWAFGVAVLFANEMAGGYPLPSWLEFGGLLVQWQVFFKCTMMRMLSFNLDYLDAVSRGSQDSGVAASEKKDAPPDAETQRIRVPRPIEEYSFVNYVGYCLYAPLYLAGPILSFNDFRAQVEHRLPSISARRTLAYAVRFILCVLCMEFILHFIPVVAMAQRRAWTGLSPAQISMVGFFNLVVIWLKLLIPWRFFRLWSLVDAIDPPENMVRCVANNYSALGFWRSWHRSFHRWVIRYLYVPLGGGKHQLRNSLIVFAFVAMWHDIQLRLFVWGGLIVLFVMPEIAGRALVPYKKFGNRPWYRFAAGVGAVGVIWMMLIANLVGFAVGVDGIQQLLSDMVHTAAGLRFTILCSGLLFVGVQVMFEYRETELREGINLRC